VRHDWPAPPALAETVMIQIGEGGHRWPALNKQIYFPSTGNQSRDLDMTTLAWDFLSRQKRQL
jgi:poly(3-hydroxybutyrate) depolymerase